MHLYLSFVLRLLLSFIVIFFPVSSFHGWEAEDKAMATASRIGWRVTLGLAAVAAAVTGAVADSMLVLVSLSTMLPLILCWYWWRCLLCCRCFYVGIGLPLSPLLSLMSMLVLLSLPPLISLVSNLVLLGLLLCCRCCFQMRPLQLFPLLSLFTVLSMLLSLLLPLPKLPETSLTLPALLSLVPSWRRC